MSDPMLALLLPGITGFFQGRVRLPIRPAEEYRRMLAEFGLRCGPAEAAVCANHHVLPVAWPKGFVLAHYYHPFVAFVDEAPAPLQQDVAFRDHCDLAPGTYETEFGPLRVLSTEEMKLPIDAADWGRLPRVEEKQARYWSPRTLGELLFNHWD